MGHMLKLVLIRGLLAFLVVVTGVVVYYAVAGVDVTVIAPGCGSVNPPNVLSLAWNSTTNGGVAKVPPFTVTVDVAPKNGGEGVTVKGPVGASVSFTLGSNVLYVIADGTPIYRSPSLLRTSTSFDLGRTKHHYIVAACR
jgi:hypothetical protein